MNPEAKDRLALHLEFPKLAVGFDLHSPKTAMYNCIAFAARVIDRWWCPFAQFPHAFWPSKVPRQHTVTAFIAAFATRGYSRCKDGELEEGYEKVAIYVDAAGKPQHMSRQLSDGRWCSKIGRKRDIIHPGPEDVENSSYGRVTVFLKRKGTPADPLSPTLI